MDYPKRGKSKTNTRTKKVNLAKPDMRKFDEDDWNRTVYTRVDMTRNLNALFANPWS